MIDDPHDPSSASWRPATKQIVWCPVCKDDMEVCGCGRVDHKWVIPMVMLFSAVTSAVLFWIFVV